MQRLLLKRVRVAVVMACARNTKIHVPAQRIVPENVVETTFVTRRKRASLALKIVGIAQVVAVFQTIRRAVMTL